MPFWFALKVYSICGTYSLAEVAFLTLKAKAFGLTDNVRIRNCLRRRKIDCLRLGRTNIKAYSTSDASLRKDVLRLLPNEELKTYKGKI